MKNLTDIIYPELEPNVICRDMIYNAFMNCGYEGEKLRLHQMQEFAYEKITILRLEFLNILRIDHLWVMSNLTLLSLCHNKIEVIENIGMLTKLTELNLSFNYIAKIENIETLVNLEVLSLYSNFITEISGLDTLNKLVILSIGENQIQDLLEIANLRLLNGLKILNLEGNAFPTDLDCSLTNYVAGLLPNVIYYNYMYIESDFRMKSVEKLERVLRQLNEAQASIIEARIREAEEYENQQKYTDAFVEYLDGHQLFDSIWENDDDGKVLISIEDSHIEDLMEKYRSDIFTNTQEIFKLGLAVYEQRQAEIDLFDQSIQYGQNQLQQEGHKVLEKYFVQKNETFAKVKLIVNELETRSSRGENEEYPEYEVLLDHLMSKHYEFFAYNRKTWHILMSDEMHLFESKMEVIQKLELNLTQMISKFVEQAQSFFAQIRDALSHFAENLNELAQHYVSMKKASRLLNDLPEGLRVCAEDKECVHNFLAGMKDVHIGKIDEREDLLSVRSRDFVQNLISTKRKEEMDRNRIKILEIDDFFEQLNNSIQQMQADMPKY